MAHEARAQDNGWGLRRRKQRTTGVSAARARTPYQADGRRLQIRRPQHAAAAAGQEAAATNFPPCLPSVQSRWRATESNKLEWGIVTPETFTLIGSLRYIVLTSCVGSGKKLTEDVAGLTPKNPYLEVSQTS
ncbi:unnamed protein product [Urochloa humidicola]